MRRAFAALGLVLVVGVGGCGDEPKRTATTTADDQRLTREEYVRRADAICADYDRRLDDLPDPEDVGEVAELAEEAFPIVQEGIRKLRELRPPQELGPQVEAWLRLNDANARSIHSLEEAAGDGDVRRVQEIASEAAENERRADELAKELGLEECAKSEEPEARR